MKKIISFLLCLVLAMCCTVNAFAYTPKYEAPAIPKVPEIKVELSDSMKDAVNTAVKKQLEKMILAKPVITDASYYKSDSINSDYAVLAVSWGEVDGATSYKVKVTKTDGTSKTYDAKYRMLSKCSFVDDFILDGMTNATIQVRAYGENETYGMWSDSQEVTYNEYW